MADGYLRNLLSGGEVVLIEAKQHPIAVVKFALKPILLLGLAVALFLFNQILDFGGVLDIVNDIVRVVLIFAAVVAVIWLPIDIVQWLSRRYILTNRRVIRMYGVVSKNSIDSSIEHVNDIESTQSAVGRLLGYTNLTIYTASDQANESFEQLIDGLQFKKAVLDAKEAIRIGSPLMALPEGFVVRGGTNEASIKAYQKQDKPAATEGAVAGAAGGETGASELAAAEPEAAEPVVTAGVEPEVVEPPEAAPPEPVEPEPFEPVEAAPPDSVEPEPDEPSAGTDTKPSGD